MIGRRRRRLPYPGLRAFEREETDLFFGRSGCVSDMIRRLGASRFLAVLGASGSGKSSLVRTGLLDGLELGLLAEAGSWWRIIEIRPGADPIGALARGLAGGQQASDADVEKMRALLLEGPRSITAWCRADGTLAEGENLLILVDQFEELFRFQHYEGQQEAQAFVNLLVESAQNHDASVYVTLTMRSEFLSACALFPGLAEAMNDGQYLTPRMNRDQCREAIEGPAALCGFSIEPALVNRLLNDLSDFAPWEDRIDQTSLSQLDRIFRRADQLPLLQHALNRLWMRAGGQSSDVVLKLADYEQLGGLRGALDQHADEVMEQLGTVWDHVVEQVFRALITGSSISDAVRRPTRFDELVAITGASPGDVAAVCNAFRAQGCNFLRPYQPAPLKPDTIVDISHESLIRQWTKLAKWVEIEANDVESLRRLNSARQSGDPLRGRELSRLAGWRDEVKITDAWAGRHVDNPADAFAFLERSKEAERLDRRGKARLRAALGILGAIVLVAGIAFWFQYRNQAELEVARADAVQAAAKAAEAAALADQERIKAEAAAGVAETERQKAEKARAEADQERMNAEAAAARAEAEQARAEGAARELDTTLSQTVDTIWEYVGGFVDNLQRSGELTRSADLLASLAAATGDPDRLPQRLVDRFAWQTMAASSGLVQADAAAPGTSMKRVGREGLAQQFALWRDRDGDGTISVVDRRNGRSLSTFAFDESALGALRKEGDHFLSLDGRHALLIGDEGRLYRWSAGDKSARRVFDRRWITPKNPSRNEAAGEASRGRVLKEAVFAADSGDIAVIYSEFDTDFLTVIPQTRAWLSPSWPLYQIERGIEQSLNIEFPHIGSGQQFNVLALVHGDLILRLNWDDGEGLARFNISTKAVSWLVAPAVRVTAWQTNDPEVLRIDPWVSMTVCRQGLAAIEAVMSGKRAEADPDDVYSMSCFVDLDVITGKLKGEAQIVPYITPWRPGAMPLPKGVTAIEMTADRLPGWITMTSPAADGVNIARDLTVLESWLRSGAFRFPVSSNGVDAVSTESGRRIARTEPQGSESRDEPSIELARIANAAVDQTSIGQRVEWTSYRFAQRLLDLAVDGSGTVALGFDGQSWFYAELSDDEAREPRLVKLPTSVSTACGKHLKGSGPIDDGRLETRGVMKFGSQQQRGGFHLRPIHSSKPFFVTVMPDRSVALVALELKAEAGERRVSIWCPPLLEVDRIAAIDTDLGTVAMVNDAAGKVYVLGIEGAAEDKPALRSTRLPKGESLRDAAFAGNSKLIVLTNAGQLRRYDTARLSDHPQDLPLFLPAADKIAARGNTVLLVRQEQGSDTSRWTSAAIVDFAGDAASASTSYLGFLPFPINDETAILLGQGNGRIDVVTPHALLSFSIPRTPSAGELARAVAATANPANLEASGEASLVELGANAVGKLEMSVRPEDGAQFGCVSSIEAALHARETGGGDAASQLDRAEALCGPNPGATATATLELLRIGFEDTGSLEYEWPVPVSKLLQLAANGDGVALRALMVWAGEKGQTSILGRASGLLLEDFDAFAQRDGARQVSDRFLGFALANADGANPYLHRALAYAAEVGGSERAPAVATAVRHYWIAERLFDAAKDEKQAGFMAQRRTGLANQMAVSARAAVAFEVSTWAPRPFPPDTLPDPPSSYEERLASDLLQLDRLVASIGHEVAFDLVRLHVLSLRLEAAELQAAKANIRKQMADIVLGRSDWPPLPLGTSNELLDVFDSLAAPESALADEARLRLRLATVKLIEASAAPLDLLSWTEASEIYLAALEDAARRAPKDLSIAAADFKFGTRVFAASQIPDVAANDETAVRRAERIFTARVALASLLADRRDAQIARDVSKFWLARFLIKQPDGYMPNKAAEEERLLREAMTGLAALPVTETALDDLAVLALAATWVPSRLYSIESNTTMPPELLAARAANEVLDDAAEEGRWTAVWTDHAASHMRLLDWMSKLGTDPKKETPFGPHEAHYVELRMSALRLFANWQRLLLRGGSSDVDDVDMAKERIKDADYAAAALAARQRFVNAPYIPRQTECDRLASALIDPDRRAPGIPQKSVEVDRAMEACNAAHLAAPGDPTTVYQLARMIEFSGGDMKAAKTSYIESANFGYAAAFNNLSILFEDTEGDLWRDLHDAYSQRVFGSHFADIYAAVKPVATSPSDQDVLRLLAERAARLGSPDASLALAQTETDAAQRKFRLLVARQQFARKGNMEQVTVVDELINDMHLSEEEDQLAAAKAKTWADEPLIGMDDELRSKILERGRGG